MALPPVYICAAKRSPIGSFMGSLASLSAVEIARNTLENLISSSGLPSNAIDEIIMGCVLSAGLGQAPARQVALKAGLDSSIRALTINKVCSSGLKAVMLGADSIQLNRSTVVVAGGMESMSRAPHLLNSSRKGIRLGAGELVDSIINDGLWDVYNDFHMGSAGELCAKKFSLTRDMQDEYAKRSYTRALEAITQGHFTGEIAPITVTSKRTDTIISIDDEPGRGKIEKFPQLKPVFDPDGTITAANASPLNDGAALVVLCSEDALKKYNLTPLARLIAQSSFSQAPEWFTTAPVGAIQSLLTKTNKTIDEIDLFEINEAFSAVALAAIEELSLSPERLNIHGGAVALGHPLGASGARILTTLVYALEKQNGKLGIAALCNGGGEATAVLIEKLN